MKKFLTILTICSVIPLAGCMRENHNLPPPGHYDRTSSSTQPNGTTVDHENSTDVTVDEYGRRTAVIKNSTTTDPNGLFNSRTNTNTEVVHER